MKPTPKHISLFFLRVALGGLFLYAGVSKILDPSWSAEGFLNSAQTFHGFYVWLASPALLPLVNFINTWALTLLGISLLLGIFVHLSSTLGAILMLLYYFPDLNFPYVEHGFLIDEHIIYIFALIYVGIANSGRIWGIDAFRNK